VPRHEGRIVGLLDEEIRRPAEEVRAVEVFDRVHDLVVAHEVGEPGEEQV
jgi:hypothetical protein